MQTFLSDCPIDFQILGIFESTLKSEISTATNIQLLRFKIEHMSIKFATWGALLFITDNINWKPRPTLDVKKENEPDSSFIEIFQKRFQLYYIKTLTERFTREKNKEVIPLSIPTDVINLFEKIRIRKSSHHEGEAM